MSGPAPLHLVLPDELINAVVERVLERLDERDRPAAEPWIGVDEAAEHLACKKHRIYGLVHERESTGFPFRKEGSRLLFRRSEIDLWLENRVGANVTPLRRAA